MFLFWLLLWLLLWLLWLLLWLLAMLLATLLAMLRAMFETSIPSLHLPSLSRLSASHRWMSSALVGGAGDWRGPVVSDCWYHLYYR
jgi:hypothetical protein